MNYESYWFNNISTTDGYESYDVELIVRVWEFTAYVASAAIVLLICLLVYRELKRRKKNEECISWDTLSDFNGIRSNFRSIESVKMYISGQSLSTEMVISNLFLLAAIFINTFTNINAFWHYHQEEILKNDEISVITGSDAKRILVSLEVMLTMIMILMALSSCICKANYLTSIQLMVTMVPNMSAMVYFTFLNTKMQKTIICGVWRDKKGFMSKLFYTFFILLLMLMMCLVGLWVFVVKVHQISYIYDTDVSLLGWADFIAVLGVARQFASLYSMGDGAYCFEYMYTTMHPTKKKQLTDDDPKWDKKYDIRQVICRDMIKTHGFIFGYCWCCYMFNDLDNVKRLYLENYDDEQQFLMMVDNP